jgi:uncharacterized membrane-anchored protein
MNGLKIAAAAAASSLLLAFAAGDASAQDGAVPAAVVAHKAELQKILHSQHPGGDVRVRGTNATLHLGSRYYFLTADEAKLVLAAWGNPPNAADGVLGMVFPTGTTFVDQQTWTAVITYVPDGYVSDKDADEADYHKLIDEAREGEDADNQQRKKDGFTTAHLVGWAQPPSYDKAHHYMIWARDIHFDGEDTDTLNYDVRVLGRRGYLSLNVVSSMDKLLEIRAAAAQLAAVAAFDPGAAYGDYQPGGDKKAEYGIAGLVAAGIGVAAAHKLGLLAVVAVFAKKLIVLIVAGFAALAARFKRLFGKRPDA